MISGLGNAILLGSPYQRAGGDITTGTSTTILMDEDTEQIAVKICPEANQHVTHVDMYIGYAGDHTGINYIIDIETDNADAPSGTLVGAATAEFAGTNGTTVWCGGGTNPIELGTHADLTANTPYWLVFKRSSGGSLSGTVKAGGAGVGLGINPDRVRLYNGTNWTTVTATNVPRPAYVLKVGTLYYGVPLVATSAASGQTHIFNSGGTSNKQGICFTVGCKMYLRGVFATFLKAGSPNSLVVTVYSDTTPIGSPVTIPAASIVTIVPMYIWFPTPIALTPDVKTYIILSQDTGDKDTSNDYSLRSTAINANYITALHDDNFRMVVGTASPPTTEINTESPSMCPIISDMSVDLDQTTTESASASSTPSPSSSQSSSLSPSSSASESASPSAPSASFSASVSSSASGTAAPSAPYSIFGDFIVR